MAGSFWSDTESRNSWGCVKHAVFFDAISFLHLYTLKVIEMNFFLSTASFFKISVVDKNLFFIKQQSYTLARSKDHLLAWGGGDSEKTDSTWNLMSNCSVLWMVIGAIVPLLLLAFCNCRLLLEIRRIRKLDRYKVTTTRHPNNTSKWVLLQMFLSGWETHKNLFSGRIFCTCTT